MTNNPAIANHLLPPNASGLERKLAGATACVESVPVPLRELWDAHTCPERFLPWLAWGLAVDRWDDDWSADLKRAVIENSLTTHKIRGTRRAVREAVRMVLALADARANNETLHGIDDLAGYDNSFHIREWWEQTADEVYAGRKREPLTFTVQLLIGQGVLGGRGILGGELYRDLRRAIDVVKPLSTRYQLSIGGARLDAVLPQIHGALRVRKYARFDVAPSVALQFKVDMKMANTVRAVRRLPLTVKPLPALQLRTDMKVTAGVRAVNRLPMSVSPLPVLQLRRTLPLQSGVRAMNFAGLTATPVIADSSDSGATNDATPDRLTPAVDDDAPTN